ncbi:MAG TPA: exostosin family protein [Fimbriimonas sp.]
MSPRVRVFAFDGNRLEDHELVPYVAPALGRNCFIDRASVLAGVFKAWEDAPRLFTTTPRIESCDYAVLPFAFSQTYHSKAKRSKVREAIERSARAGKPLLVFFSGDQDERIDWPPHVHVVRFSVDRSSVHEREIVDPMVVRDMCEESGIEPEPRAYREKPSVGFVGHAPPLGSARLKDWIKLGLFVLNPERGRNQAPRAAAILALRCSGRISSQITVRREFAFNRWGVLEVTAKRRREYVDNLLASDYALCVRGIANCSLRLFEAMSLGRIPVLLDTDTALPRADAIDWDSLVIRIDRRQWCRMGAIISESHLQMGPQEFLRRQRECRQAFAEHLKLDRFFAHLHATMVDHGSSSLRTTDRSPVGSAG